MRERISARRHPTSLSGTLNGVRIALPPVPFAFLYHLSKEIFDLTINAAQFVLRPGFQFGPELRVNTIEHWTPSHTRKCPTDPIPD
jgi:hypothetical protein